MGKPLLRKRFLIRRIYSKVIEFNLSVYLLTQKSYRKDHLNT